MSKKSALTIDTNDPQRRGQAPTQVYRYESKTPELSFKSLADFEGLSREVNGGLRQEVEHGLPVRPAAERSVSDITQPLATASDEIYRGFLARSQTAFILQSTPRPEQSLLSAPFLAPQQRRIKGFRPAPLDLSKDVSPADRAFSNGAMMMDPPSSWQSGIPSYPAPCPESRTWLQQAGRAPTIVITPAQKGFHSDYVPRREDQQFSYRPSSSVYSHYSSGVIDEPLHGNTPNTSPSPLSIGRQPSLGETAVATFEGDVTSSKSRVVQIMSVCTDFERNDALETLLDGCHQPVSRSMLSTPRRSRGWWSVVTSPFLAAPRSHPFMSRSPSLIEDQEDETILQDAGEIGSSEAHRDNIVNDCAPDYEELRLAPLLDPELAAHGSFVTVDDYVNIHDIPSHGLAAAYYDLSQRFPSLIMVTCDASGERGAAKYWSAVSRSHAHRSGTQESLLDDESTSEKDGIRAEKRTEEKSAEALHGQEEGRFSMQQVESVGTELARAQRFKDRGTFSAPADTELQCTGLVRPTVERNGRIGTLEFLLPPPSAIPVAGDARVTTINRPYAYCGELRQVELSPPAPQIYASLSGASRKAIGHLNSDRGPRVASEKAPSLPMTVYGSEAHESRGLGISNSHAQLFPPPRPMSEEPQSRGDSFGQMAMSDDEGRSYSTRPWYRRFFCVMFSLAFLAAVVLTALLVLLLPH